MDVDIDVPLELDVSHWRGHGKQAGETLLPEAEEEVCFFLCLHSN